MSAGQYYMSPTRQPLPYTEDRSQNQTFYDGHSEEESIEPSLSSRDSRVNSIDTNAASEYASAPDYSYDYPINAPYGTPAHEAIPIQFEIEGIYEDLDRRRKQLPQDGKISTHTHSRRRAQNRASQRAFRDRKEKHVKEVEERLKQLEGKYNDLSESYDSLRKEYVTVKKELEKLVLEEDQDYDGFVSPTTDRSIGMRMTTSSSFSVPSGSDLDCLHLFDDSMFSFDPDNMDGNHEQQRS